jgi:hypothetical protein
MKYAVLIYEDPTAYDGLDQAALTGLTDEYMAVRNDPVCIDGARLQPASTATTIRVDDGEMLLTDGPFADTKEILGGFFVFEAGDLDTALELAARIPAARLGGKVEVRPLVEMQY